MNLTLPDVPENYIHRIGRVGRADAVGLAISLVATEKEKVWFHKCPSKGIICSFYHPTSTVVFREGRNLPEHKACRQGRVLHMVLLDPAIVFSCNFEGMTSLSC